MKTGRSVLLARTVGHDAPRSRSRTAFSRAIASRDPPLSGCSLVASAFQPMSISCSASLRSASRSSARFKAACRSVSRSTLPRIFFDRVLPVSAPARLANCVV